MIFVIKKYSCFTELSASITELTGFFQLLNPQAVFT